MPISRTLWVEASTVGVCEGGEERSRRSYRRELLRRGSALRRSDESSEWGFRSAFFFLFACGTVRQCDVTAPSRGAFFKSSGVTTHRSLRFACLRRSCKETKAPLKTRGGTGKVTGRKTSRVFGEGWEGKRREGGRSVGWWTTARQKRSCRGRFNSCRRGSFCQGGSRKQVSLGRVSDFASSHYPPVLCPPH